MSKLPVCNMSGERLGEIDLADDLLVKGKGTQAVHDVVVAHLAKCRAGTASTLRKGEVAGSNKKPWQQKGTGRARAGFRQSPVWRGGGVAFGPKPRSYAKKVTKKTARLAFQRALSEKVASGAVTVIDQMTMPKAKTKDFAVILKKLDAVRSALVVTDTTDRNLALAARNVPNVEVVTAANVHTYQVLRHHKILVSKSAMEQLVGRLKAGRSA